MICVCLSNVICWVVSELCWPAGEALNECVPGGAVEDCKECVCEDMPCCIPVKMRCVMEIVKGHAGLWQRVFCKVLTLEACKCRLVDVWMIYASLSVLSGD